MSKPSEQIEEAMHEYRPLQDIYRTLRVIGEILDAQTKLLDALSSRLDEVEHLAEFGDRGTR